MIGNLTQLIARDLQRARNTRITDGNEAGTVEIRNMAGRQSQSPLRSALKTSQGQPVRRDLSESFARQGNEKLEQL